MKYDEIRYLVHSVLHQKVLAKFPWEAGELDKKKILSLLDYNWYIKMDHIHFCSFYM